ncbi:MAG: hypothetical protein AABY22_05360 [Nanoarchaeota archaeon]|mgnify:CR=1 FL=1
MKVKNTIKLNSYAIISEAVEKGIMFGYKHAHKYDDKPDGEIIKEHIYNDIMNELSEIIIWDENDER